MSSTLYWKPIKDFNGYLPDELKHALQKSDCFNNSIDRDFDDTDIPYLTGLKDGGVKGAAKLISLIKKYGTVRVEEQF